MEPAEAVVTWKDLAAAARHRACRSRVWLLVVPLCLVFLALAVLGPALGLRLVGLVLLVYVGTAPLWGPTAATWLEARRRRWPSHPTRWQATDDGIAIDSQAGSSTLPWSTLTDATSWRRGVSLTYGRAVAFIPRRAFQSNQHRQEFVATAQTFKVTNRA